MRNPSVFLSILAVFFVSMNGYAIKNAYNPPNCYIGEIDAAVLPCNEAGDFFVLLDFEYENVGEQGFSVLGNGNDYGDFEYDDLPVEIGPLAGDGVTVYEFIVKDNENPDCSNWTGIDPVDCNGGGSGECNIWDLLVDDNPCTDDGLFTVYLDFEYENVSEDGFKLFVNDDLLGMYDYQDLPLQEVGPFEGDGETEYHFFVRDIAYEDCAEDEDLGPIDCEGGGGGDECDLSDIEIEVLPCDEEGFFSVEIDFEYENTSEAFHLWVNNETWADYAYSSLPVTIGPFEGDGETVWFFVAADVVYDDCAINTHIEPVDCDGGGGGDCSIDDVEATILPCNEEGNFFVLLDFEYENGSELGFGVVGNGTDYGDFEYEDLPVEIGPLEGDGVTVYEFEARDNFFEDCYDWTEIEPVDCSSAPMLNNLTTEITSCEGGLFSMQVDFNAEGTLSGQFTITGNGQDYGTYSYSQLPVALGPMDTNGEASFYFIVRDQGTMPYGNWNRLVPFTCETLGMDETGASKDYAVHYNHLDHSLVVRYTGPGSGSALARVTDMYGRNMASGNVSGSKSHIMLPGAFSGAAVWIIVSGKEQYRGKVIIP